jgi:RNA polymerase sigma factor (sigma-70 family)
MSQPPRDSAVDPGGDTIELTAAADVTDGQLLERFVNAREAAAFRALLQRHGPMVLGVCRRILRHDQDAEDAFQATFLVLIRKASSIAKRDSVGSWLYGVAYRVAMKAKTRALKRRSYETQAVTRPMTEPHDELIWRELMPILDEEVHRLPEKYREPVVLCYLQGRPYSEAARQLGCSKGSIALRLAEARERLRDRLKRRGVVFGLIPGWLGSGRLQAPVGDELRETTTHAALHWISGDQAARALPASILGLTRAGLAALAWAKLKVAIVVLLAVTVVGGSASIFLHRLLSDKDASAEIGSNGRKKGKKTLADRLDGLPTKIKKAP